MVATPRFASATDSMSAKLIDKRVVVGKDNGTYQMFKYAIDRVIDRNDVTIQIAKGSIVIFQPSVETGFDKNTRLMIV
jgi:hypothetical protein